MDTATTATPLNVCESEDPHFDKEEVFALPPAYDPSAGRVPDVGAPSRAPMVSVGGEDVRGDQPQMSDVVKRLLKTRFCRYGVHCKYGSKCFYAHSPEELRQRPPPPPGYRKAYPPTHAAPFPPEHMAAMMASQDPMMGYPPPLGFLPEAMAQLMPPMGDLRVNMMPYSLPEPAADSGYSGYDPTGSAIPAAAVPQRATQVAGQPNAPVVSTLPEHSGVRPSHSGLTAAQIANLLKVASSNENASEE